MSFGNDLLVCFDRISGRMISEMKLLIREKKGISIIQRYVSKSDNTSYTQMTSNLYRCELSNNMLITHPTRKHCRTTGFFSVIYNRRLKTIVFFLPYKSLYFKGQATMLMLIFRA